jgi:hypothetical protein
MNKIDEFTEAKIREMIRHGYSTRKIASRAGVSKNTAQRYLAIYRTDAPPCQHGKPLYECPSCACARRTLSAQRDIIWLRPGPPRRRNRSAEEVLHSALISVQEDKDGAS